MGNVPAYAQTVKLTAVNAVMVAFRPKALAILQEKALRGFGMDI
jgi:hypothetical protein